MTEVRRRGRKPIVDTNAPEFEELRKNIESLLNVPKTVAEVSQIAGISVAIINRWIRQGVIKRDAPARRGRRPAPLADCAGRLVQTVRDYGKFPSVSSLLKKAGVSRDAYGKIIAENLVDIDSLVERMPRAGGRRSGVSKSDWEVLLPYCHNERERTIAAAKIAGSSTAEIVNSLNPRRSTSEVQYLILRLKSRAWDAAQREVTR